MATRPFRQQMMLPAASAAGTSTYNGDGPPAGFVDNVSFGFPTAPMGALFTLTVANVVVASWTGPTPWGPLLVANSETIQVAASGLSPGVVYAGVMAGSRHPADEVPASAPQFGPATVAVVNLASTVLAILTGFSTGTRADGAVTLTSGATLTRSMNYSSLTVNAGVLLDPGGFIIYCTGTVTVNGTIANNGGNGANGSAGTGGLGLPGTAGAAFYQGGQGGSASTAGAPPGGGTAEGGPGGAGVQTAGGATVASPPGALSIDGLNANTYGGGGGGGGSTSGSADGGGGGGVVMIFCGSLAGSGSIQANGGNGYLSAGGGGGGIVFVATNSATNWAGTMTATGGTSSTTAGGPGKVGLVVS